MVRLRLLLVWLLMAAIPMQGFAAASMLFCGMGTEHMQAHTTGASQASLGSRQVQEIMHHEHSSHDHATAGARGKTTTDIKQGVADTAHKCSICAACCNGVAIVGLELGIAVVPVAQATLAEPFVLIHTRPSPVPDKPPRA